VPIKRPTHWPHHAHVSSLIIWVGLAVVLIGLACSWRIGRSITQPLERLADAMKRLAAGDTSVTVPSARSRDEIGAMAARCWYFATT